MNKLNKTRLFLSGVLLFVCTASLPAQQALSLDGVIVQAAKDMEARLSAGAKLAVLNFTSTAEAFSDYVIEELSGALVMNRKVTVIERKSLDLVRREMNLQLSGDVSDDSAQAIGKQLGAQAIVTGSLTNLGDTYRFRVKVINVETARIEAQFSYNLGNNQQVAFLLSGNQQNAPAVPSQPAAQAVPAPAAPVTYKVGDTGPAGGLIFYDKGNNTGGWRYLEAAPASAEFTATWDPPGRRFDLRGSNDVALGKGLDNTKAIVTLFSQNGGGFGSAAWDCNDLVVNNFDDWFLPSLTELSYIYGNLHRKGLGGFSSNQYWSSTRHESDDDYAYYINFQDASQGGTYRNNKYYVRAIRQF